MAVFTAPSAPAVAITPFPPGLRWSASFMSTILLPPVGFYERLIRTPSVRFAASEVARVPARAIRIRGKAIRRAKDRGKKTGRGFPLPCPQFLPRNPYFLPHPQVLHM